MADNADIISKIKTMIITEMEKIYEEKKISIKTEQFGSFGDYIKHTFLYPCIAESLDFYECVMCIVYG